MKSKFVKNSVSYENKKVNMLTLLIFIFITCCTIGFLVETVYTFIRKGHLINRQGLIYGPFIPIYGLGGILITLVFYKIQQYKSYIIFIIASILGSGFEYLCSVIQEYVFKSRSWNYTKFKYDINGRVNLTHTFYWGILAVIFIKLFLPLIIKLINKIPRRTNRVLTITLTTLMVLDVFISASAIIRQSQRIEGIAPNNKFETFLDNKYNDTRMKKVYTNMKFLNKME